MDVVLELLRLADTETSRATTSLRTDGLTTLFVIASAWWVKAPLFLGVAAGHDLLRRRPRLPVAAFAVLAAVLCAGALSSGLKALFDRARPPLAGIGVDAVGALPGSASFPSGHATTAFAAATALALLVPRLRWIALAVAVTVAVSRVYLGMHFLFDVLVGAGLGVAVGLACVGAVRRLVVRRLPGERRSPPALAGHRAFGAEASGVARPPRSRPGTS